MSALTDEYIRACAAHGVPTERMEAALLRLLAHQPNASYRELAFQDAALPLLGVPEIPAFEVRRRYGPPHLPWFFTGSERWRTILFALGGLREDSRIVEPGCGCGRMAWSLTGAIPQGAYVGFDVDPDAVGWATMAYATHKNMAFIYHRVRNMMYGGQTGLPAPDGVPWPIEESGGADLVFAQSVWTHLLQKDAEWYFREAARVLKPGGRFVTSFFMLDWHGGDAPLDGLGLGGLRGFNYTYEGGDPDVTRCGHPGTPELAVGYHWPWVFDTTARLGLELVSTWPGIWAPRAPGAPLRGHGLDFQDVVVWEKK